MEKLTDIDLLYLVLSSPKYASGLIILLVISYWLIRKVIGLNNELSKMIQDSEDIINNHSHSNNF